MANGDLSAAEAKAKVERYERSQERERQDERVRDRSVQTGVGFVATRAASNLLDRFFPSFAGIKPIVEIGGGAYSAMKGIDPRDDAGGYWLGSGLALLTPVVDRVSQFAVDTVDKFKNKAGK